MVEVVEVAAPAREPRTLGRYPLLLPSRHDPRLRVAAVILTIHALGQGPLQFDVSIAQILCSLLVCAVLDVAIVFARDKAIVWPASALLTGSGVALLLRIPGTEHGDWFSTNGLHIVAGTAAVSLLSKHLLRVGGAPLFNPSNIGLVACFLVLGSDRVDPQDLWWGPTNAGLVFAVVLIVVGGLTVTSRLGLLGMAFAFWVTFASGVAVNSASGHCMTARWSFEPVCGGHYFTTVALSPEVLIFLFFMITDPRSTPRGRVAQLVFGALVGMVAGLLVAFQSTEFATKVAILGALVVVCAFRPVVTRLCPEQGAEDDSMREWLAPKRRIVALVFLPVTAYLLWVVGLERRFNDDPANATLVASVAPRAAIGDVQVPPVTLDPDAERIATGFDQTAADAAARDLVSDLDVEVRAVRHRDRTLAMSSSSGDRLDDVLATIDAASAGRVSTLSTYRVTQLRAVLSRSRPQDVPTLRFEATATIVPLRADGTFDEAAAVEGRVVFTMADGPGGTRLISSAT